MSEYLRVARVLLECGTICVVPVQHLDDLLSEAVEVEIKTMLVEDFENLKEFEGVI